MLTCTLWKESASLCPSCTHNVRTLRTSPSPTLSISGGHLHSSTSPCILVRTKSDGSLWPSVLERSLASVYSCGLQVPSTLHLSFETLSTRLLLSTSCPFLSGCLSFRPSLWPSGSLASLRYSSLS